MTQSTGSSSRARSGMVAVAVALALANLLGYGFNLVASRRLGPAGYGAVGALLGLLLIGNVVALALQAVIARRAAAGGGDAAVASWAGRLSWRCAVGATLLTALAAPFLATWLHLSSVLPALLLAATLGPLTLLGGQLGMLQGTERFPPLAQLYLIAAVGKVGGGIAGVMLVDSVSGAMAGTAAGTAAAAAFGATRVRAALGSGAGRTGGFPRGVGRETARAAYALGALFALANVDVILARHFLTPHDAGLYAVGAVVAKGAFWLPSFVPVIALPGLSDPRRRKATTGWALAVETASAVLLTAGAALLGPLLVRVVGGSAYDELAGRVWLFALAGSSLAIAQLLLYSRLAAEDHRIILPMWLLVGVEVLVVAGWRHGSPTEIVTVVVAVTLTLAAAGAVTEAREHGILRRGRRGAPTDGRAAADA